MGDPEHAADEVSHRVDHQAIHVDGRHAVAGTGQIETGGFGVPLRRAVSRGVEGGHDPSPPDAHVRHPELHRAGRMAKGHDGAKDGRRDDRLLPRSPAAMDSRREVRLQQFRLLPARCGHRKSDRKKIRGRGAGADLCSAGNGRQRLRLVRHGYSTPRVRLLRPAAERPERGATRYAAAIRRRLAVLHDRGPAEVGPGALHRPVDSGGGETDDVDAGQGELRVRMVDRHRRRPRHSAIAALRTPAGSTASRA